MYDVATIVNMNRAAGRRALREDREPMLVTSKVGIEERIRHIPNMGTYRARNRGWRLVRTYFVDSSGFGSPGEAALTFEEFARQVKVGFGYGIIEAGQFQVVIGEFKKVA